MLRIKFKKIMGEILNKYLLENNTIIHHSPQNSSFFPKKIKTKNNEIYLNMEERNSELYITCYYEKNYFKHTFSGSFSLETLKQTSDYYKMFQNVNDVITEFICNKSGKEIYIIGDEESMNSINIVIPTTLENYKELRFTLFYKNKSLREKSEEKDYVINRYEYEDWVFGLNQSKILINKDLEKKAIKFWISPNKRLTAKLLYSFHSNIKFYYQDENIQEINKFHEACNKKSKILILCKSKNEIFGGYTPLCFDSSNTDKKDNKSFLFSLNKFEKYSKNSPYGSKSINCHKNYGPGFYKDLQFLENYINIVTFKRSNYVTEDNWVNKHNCYQNSKGVILEDLEIFQIEEKVYDRLEYELNNNNHNNININRRNNIGNVHNNLNNININRRNNVRNVHDNLNNTFDVNINNINRNILNRNNLNNSCILNRNRNRNIILNENNNNANSNNIDRNNNVDISNISVIDDGNISIDDIITQENPNNITQSDSKSNYSNKSFFWENNRKFHNGLESILNRSRSERNVNHTNSSSK